MTARELLAMPAPSGTDEVVRQKRQAVEAAVDAAYKDMETGALASLRPSTLEVSAVMSATYSARRRPRSS